MDTGKTLKDCLVRILDRNVWENMWKLAIKIKLVETLVTKRIAWALFEVKIVKTEIITKKYSKINLQSCSVQNKMHINQ